MSLPGRIMGKREDLMVDYYGRNAHFAELLNGWIFHGKAQIHAGQIREGNLRYVRKNGKGRFVKHRALYRDILKKIENIHIRIIIGTELQTYVDYSMPVRAMDYDVGEYKRQVERIQHTFREKNPGSVRLSRIGKEDRLSPTITLVLYLGEEPWDGAQNLHGILDMTRIPEDMRPYVADYPLHVLDVCHTDDQRLMEFPRDIACMFLILKYQKDKKQLVDLLEHTALFQSIGSDTYETVWQYTNEVSLLEKLESLENEKGEVNMCQAIREMAEDYRNEGIQTGLQQGIRIFILDNQEEQIPKERIILKLQRRFELDAEEANHYYEQYAE